MIVLGGRRELFYILVRWSMVDDIEEIGSWVILQYGKHIKKQKIL